MFMRAVLILAAGALVLVALWRLNAAELTHPLFLEQHVPGPVQEAMRGATRVEAVLVHDSRSAVRPASEDSTRPKIQHLPIRSSPVPLSPEQAQELTALLLDRHSFQDEDPDCIHRTDVAYRFITAADTAEVLVCHGCDHVVLHGRSEHGWGNVRPIGLQLEALSHALFPADSLITAMWQEGRRPTSP